MLCIAGLDGYFSRLNPAWQTTLGWKLEQLQARPFIEFVHADDRSSTLAEVGKLRRGKKTICFENRYRCRDGSFRWLQWNASVLPGSEQIYAIARDVTLQKSLEAEVVAATDREQERLGLELHDGLCQNLAGIAATSAALSLRLAARSMTESAAAAEITTLVNSATKLARDLARGFAAIHLRGIGLAAELEELSSNLEGLFHIACGLRCNRPSLRLGDAVEAHLFRIAQQGTSNAIIHGKAKRIEIGITISRRKGTLSIRDDGVGIHRETRGDEGIGLHAMAYRARLIGASLQVRPRAPRGTIVTCEFPLPPGTVESG
jgi:PAS domain S-box-containing protein